MFKLVKFSILLGMLFLPNKSIETFNFQSANLDEDSIYVLIHFIIESAI